MGDVLLRVEGITRRGVLRDCSFEVHAGEILGFAGIVGAGRTELARAVFGADPIDDGTIELDGKALKIHSPRDAIDAGIGYVTEDRKGEGLALQLGIEPNITLAHVPGKAAWIDRRAEHEAAEKRAERARHPRALAAHAGADAVRRQPAEGRRGQVAGDRRARAVLRRARARHRRRHQGRAVQADRRARGRTGGASS